MRYCRCLVILLPVILIGCSSSEYVPPGEEDKFQQAMVALSEDKNDEAIQLLKESIDINPTTYAYFLRATLLEQQGDDQAAIADCEAGLQLEAEHEDLTWLLAECQKSKGQRFQGVNALAPSHRK